MNVDIMRMLALASDEGGNKSHKIGCTEDAAVERLKEFYVQYRQNKVNFPFKTGDMVMTKPGFGSSIVGIPCIVLEIQANPKPHFDGSPTHQSFGRIPEMRVGLIIDDAFVTFWGEAVDYAPYDKEMAAQWRAKEGN